MQNQQTGNNDIENRPFAQSGSAGTSGQKLHATPPPTGQPDPIQPRKFDYSNASPPPSRKPKSYALRGFFSIVQLIVGAAILAFLINHLVFQPYEVFGQSMMPTLKEGDRLIVSKLGKTWATITRDDYTPKRGEIIVFHNPNSPSVQLVKRVVGLPGDRVVVKDGNLFVYTVQRPEGFDFDRKFGLDLGRAVGSVDLTVPEGEIFVVGDNRSPNGSLDSRNELGTVPLDQVVGDLTFRIFPVSEAAVF